MNKMCSANTPRMIEIAVVIITSLLILVTLTPVASAVVSDGGSKSCGAGYQRVRAYYYGNVRLYPAPSGYGARNGPWSWSSYSKYATSSGGGYWSITSTGGLDDGGTYATCHNYLP